MVKKWGLKKKILLLAGILVLGIILLFTLPLFSNGPRSDFEKTLYTVAYESCYQQGHSDSYCKSIAQTVLDSCRNKNQDLCK